MMNSNSIPIDLVIEILWRLPAKSIARFHCVSKLWASILRRPYFTQLFMARSSTQPRLLFAIEQDGVWSFFSMPQCQSPREKSSSSLKVTAEFHLKFPPRDMRIFSPTSGEFACGYASGLIYFYGMTKEKDDDHYEVPVICNPNTGRYVTLPYLLRYRKSYSFLGFDPIGKQFKVLFMAYPGCCDENFILTLGTGKMKWRWIKRITMRNEPVSKGICINGVLYYLGYRKDWIEFKTPHDYVIVCFDVRSEKFIKFKTLKYFCHLINFKGKLGAFFYDDYGNDSFELRLWVLEDVEKQEWSKYGSYALRDDKIYVDDDASVDVVGVTATGEIILSMGYYYTSKQPFYVFYYNPEINTLRSVEVKGFGTKHRGYKKKHTVYTFVDHVEDLNFNDAKLLNSSIYDAPYYQRRKKEKKRKRKRKRKRINQYQKEEQVKLMGHFVV